MVIRIKRKLQLKLRPATRQMGYGCWRGEMPFSALNTHANVVALLGTKVPRKRERVVKCKKKGKILNEIVP
jgi:hypothetical protein